MENMGKALGENSKDRQTSYKWKIQWLSQIPTPSGPPPEQTVLISVTLPVFCLGPLEGSRWPKHSRS